MLPTSLSSRRILAICTALSCSAATVVLGADPPRADRAAVSALVNQVGYEASAAKVLVVQVRGDRSIDQPAPALDVIDESGRVAFSGFLTARGRIHGGGPDDWGARYWTGDFSKLAAPGKYLARVRAGAPLYSFPFRIGPELVFREAAMPAAAFFRFQRCGCAVPGVHAACHLDDARIPGEPGGHRDATGGWHDAGDFNKYTSIACRSVYALIALTRSSRGRLPEAERKKARDEALWGAEFLRKMWQPGKGVVYHDVWNGYDYWGDPAKETDNAPGTKDDRPLRGEGPSAMTAAALAAVSGESGRRDYRTAAEDLWRGACKALANDSEDPWVKACGGIPDLGQDASGRLVRRTADLLLADLELERLTGDSRYAEDAKLRVAALVRQQNPDGLWPSDVYSRTVLLGVPPAALALYVCAHADGESAHKATAALERWLERNLRLADNPFSLIPWSEGVFFNPHVANAWSVGQNSQYLSLAWALYLTADVLHRPEARRLADRQVDWVLGVNPYGLCMLEGVGSFNPRCHHRWPLPREQGVVPGAIPNGFCRGADRADRPWFDLGAVAPGALDWHSNEPWEPHNAFFILALTARAERP